jgi:hypothetical protein
MSLVRFTNRLLESSSVPLVSFRRIPLTYQLDSADDVVSLKNLSFYFR